MTTTINVDWSTIKTFVNNRSVHLQCLDINNMYYLYAFDGPFSVSCQIVKIDPASSDQTDFEDNYKDSTNKSLVKKNSSLKPVIAFEKNNTSKFTLVTHNWADPTTWYQTAARIVDEIASDSGNHINYNLAHTNIIDNYHGKLAAEDYLLDDNGYAYRVVVKVNNVTKTEQDPHYASGGDYTVNYASGQIHFLSTLDPADVVKVTYHRMIDSIFTVKPDTDKQLSLVSAEVQLSSDAEITDSVVFQAYGYVDVFAPFLMPGIPSLTKIPLGNPVVYKTIFDYQNDATKSYPTYPAIGGSGWRGTEQSMLILDWDYASSTVLRADYGMEVRLSLQHNAPFGGTFATATFYATSEALP